MKNDPIIVVKNINISILTRPIALPLAVSGSVTGSTIGAISPPAYKHDVMTATLTNNLIIVLFIVFSFFAL